MIPFFALKFLGNGSLPKGVDIVTSAHIEKLTAWGAANDPYLGQQYLLEY